MEMAEHIIRQVIRIGIKKATLREIVAREGAAQGIIIEDN